MIFRINFLLAIILTQALLSHGQTNVNADSTTLAQNPETATLKVPLPRQYPVSSSTLLENATFSYLSNSTTDSVFKNSTEKKYVFERWHCYDGHKPNDTSLERCCGIEMFRYESRWSTGGYYLTTILERLQRWGCTEFVDECRNPTWNFSEFTSLVYDRFCDHAVLENKCVNTLQEVTQNYGFLKPPPRRNRVMETNWTILIESLVSSEMELQDLAKPCIQVALFDRKDGGVGRFHEVVEAFFPFCGIQWNGYDYDTAMYRDVSPWTGASLWCRGTMVVCIVVMALAGFATLIANIVILGVFGVTPKLRNSQAVYKISLAIADLCVGLIVWPNMIAMQYLTFFAPRHLGKIVQHPSTADNGTWFAHFPFGDETLVHRYPGGTFAQRFPRSYIVFAGFVTILVLFVSIYTLMWGSFDRFWAVFRPLRYNKHNAKKQAKIACFALWGLSILLAVLPTFIPQIKYNVISSLFIASSGLTSLILLFFGLFLPLVITWIVTIFTFETSKKHARNRERIVSTNSSSTDALERRLARTLSLMVLVFTACILPAMACIIAGFVLPQTALNDPKNLNVPVERAYTTAEYISIILLTSNSLWNCFIYSLRTRGFQEASKKLYIDFLERTKLGYIGRGALYIIQGARRVSMTSLYQMRKMSSSSTSDLRKKSVTSLSTNITKMTETSAGPRPSVDMDSTSVFIGSSTSNGYSAAYTKNGGKGGRKQSLAGIVEVRVGRKKQQREEEENDAYVGDDSTFGSFAIDAGADRFLNSVMENVNEQVEEEEEAGKSKT